MEVIYVKKKENIKVYIASPYTIGDVAKNVRKQIDMAHILIKKGYVPYAPLLSHFHHLINPLPYKTWLRLDLQWILSCDAVLRLEGKSKGADLEVKFAKENGVNVFKNFHQLEFARRNGFFSTKTYHP